MFLPILIGSLYVDQYQQYQESVQDEPEQELSVQVEISYDDGDTQVFSDDAQDRGDD